MTQTKVCPRCKTKKSVCNFHKKSTSIDGLAYECKTCVKMYYKTNKTKLLKYQKTYYKANKDKIKVYFNTNKSEIAKGAKARYEANRTEISEHKSAYQKTERGRDLSKKRKHKRRALKMNTTIEDFSPQEVFKRDGYRCQLCGVKTRPDFKNVNHPLYPNLDHIIPLSLDGEHSRLNTQCLCRKCNITKYNTGIGDQLRMFG